MTAFVKMHGCGNDFVVLRHADLEALALGPEALRTCVRRLCDRNFGIGADGVLSYDAASNTHLRMRYWNRDGSRAEMCGNGARCVVRLAWERGEIVPELTLETDAGTHAVKVQRASSEAPWVEIDMGPVRWDAGAIGLSQHAELLDAPLRVGDGTLRVTACSVGNPHAIVFVADRAALAAVDLATTGKALAEHVAFRHGTNASFVAADAGALHSRVFERGVGPTLACGSAACAALAAAVRHQLLPALTAAVHLPGGTVEVRQDADAHLWLRGPATIVAEGRLAAELLSS